MVTFNALAFNLSYIYFDGFAYSLAENFILVRYMSLLSPYTYEYGVILILITEDVVLLWDAIFAYNDAMASFSVTVGFKLVDYIAISMCLFVRNSCTYATDQAM
jgi:hypothetical protein